MVKVLGGLLIMSALTGCSTLPQPHDVCSKEPASYECQVERYQKAPD